MTKKPLPAAERVLARCVESGECLIWTGATAKKGYGNIGVGSRKDGTRRTKLVHVVVWEAEHGPVPEGLELDHLCRNRACVRPAHLEPVTHEVNCSRADHGGRVARLRAAETCKRGHPFSEANTRWSKAGTRQCRACRAAKAREIRRLAKESS